MICPNCQSENKEHAKFCNECGFPLTGRIATVAAASTSDEALRAVADKPAFAFVEKHAETQESRTSDEAPSENDDPSDEKPMDSSASQAPSPDSLQNSGPLDPSQIPLVGIAGVDVDEEGNEFDFGEIDSDEDHADTQSEDHEAADPSSHDEREESDASKTADLSGLDECLVDAHYTPPQSAWRSGGTMEMPRVEGAAAPQQKEYHAPDPHAKKHGKGRIVVIVAIVLVIAAAAAVGITYRMELWGGKVLPDVMGMTQADATYQLEDKGFTVRVTQVKSDETEGLVLLMDPGAGSRAEKGSEVVLQVAVPRTIPDVTGKTKDEAVSLFDEAGFDHVSFVDAKSDGTEGTVLSLSPEAGTKAKASTPIEAKIAVPYTVPDVAGASSDDAVAALKDASYAANVVYYYTEDVAEGSVVSTDPAAGAKLASGSTVTVSVAMSRASVLVPKAKDYLAKAGTLQLGGTTYEIISVDAVKYTGNNQTAFTITVAAITTLDGETVRGSSKQKNGTITWDDANNVVSVS